MPSIGTLAIRLVVLTSELDSGFERGKKALSGFKQDLIGLTSSLGQVGAGANMAWAGLKNLASGLGLAGNAIRMWLTSQPYMINAGLGAGFASALLQMRLFTAGTQMLVGVKSILAGLGTTIIGVGGAIWNAMSLAIRLGVAFRGVALAAAAAAVAMAGMLVGFAFKGLADAMETIRHSEVLGVTVKQMAALEETARRTGINVKTIENWLGRMQMNIGLAASGDAPMKRTMGRMGLAPGQLQDLGAFEALKTILDHLNQFPTAAERAAVAIRIFGRSGLGAAEVLRLLRIGSDGLDKIAEQAQAVGTAFGAIDASKFEEMNDRISLAKMNLRGLTIMLAIELLPVLLYAGQAFMTWVKGTERAKSGVSSIGDWVVNLIAWTLDYGAVWQWIFLQVEIGWRALMQIMYRSLQVLSAGLAFIALDFQGDSPMAKWAKDFEQMALANKALGQEAVRKSLQGPDMPGARFLNGVDLMRIKLQQAAEAAAKVNDKIGEGLNLANLKQLNDLMEKADKLIEHTRDPVETMMASLDEYDEMLKLAMIDQDVYARATQEAFVKAEKAMHLPERRLGGAFSEGTKEAVSAIVKARFQDESAGKTPEERVASLMTESVNMQRVQRRYQQEMAEALKKMRAAKV